MGNTYVYHYDAAGRLFEVIKDGSLTATYTYDDNGNRTAKEDGQGVKNGTVDAQDRLVQYAGNQYNFAKAGELFSKTGPGGNFIYNYDDFGNLLSVNAPGKQINYIIDGKNRRIGKKVGGNLVQGFLYQDDLRIIAELDANNQVVSRFVYGAGANTPDYMIKGGKTYKFITDQLGSPILIVDTDNGNVAQKLTYDEFGTVLFDSNAGFQPFGFAGGLYDQDTKLVRFGARDYDPETGRWTNKDPILFAGGDTNLYGYVLNDPVNLVDPWGLFLQYANSASEVAMKPHIQQIMTSPDGRRLLQKLHSDPTVYNIYGTPHSESPACQIGNEVYVDPTFHPILQTDAGAQPASTTRVLAHELGHLTGTLDNGPGRMNNVNEWENPIMYPIEEYNRTQYPAY